MVDTKLLEEEIRKSGKRKGFLAEKIGCSTPSFRARVHGKYDFKVDEVNALCQELNITDPNVMMKIFFKGYVDNLATESGKK